MCITCVVGIHLGCWSRPSRSYSLTQLTTIDFCPATVQIGHHLFKRMMTNWRKSSETLFIFFIILTRSRDIHLTSLFQFEQLHLVTIVTLKECFIKTFVVCYHIIICILISLLSSVSAVWLLHVLNCCFLSCVALRLQRVNKVQKKYQTMVGYLMCDFLYIFLPEHEYLLFHIDAHSLQFAIADIASSRRVHSWVAVH